MAVVGDWSIVGNEVQQSQRAVLHWLGELDSDGALQYGFDEDGDILLYGPKSGHPLILSSLWLEQGGNRGKIPVFSVYTTLAQVPHGDRELFYRQLLTMNSLSDGASISLVDGLVAVEMDCLVEGLTLSALKWMISSVDDMAASVLCEIIPTFKVLRATKPASA